MSAFVCSDNHIATIAVSFVRMVGEGDAQKIANVLLAENIKSVNFRYKDSMPILPCDISKHEADTRPAAQLFRLCECLDYQSCEHPEWEESEAKALLERIQAQFEMNAKIYRKPTNASLSEASRVWAI